MNYLSFEEVRGRLGLNHRSGLEFIINQKRQLPSGRTFEPTVRSGRTRYFTEEMVEEYERAFRDEEGLTVGEIADKYDVSPTTVRHHLKIKRKVKPRARRGRYQTFDPKVISAIARAEKWTESPRPS